MAAFPFHWLVGDNDDERWASIGSQRGFEGTEMGLQTDAQTGRYPTPPQTLTLCTRRDLKLVICYLNVIHRLAAADELVNSKFRMAKERKSMNALLFILKTFDLARDDLRSLNYT